MAAIRLDPEGRFTCRQCGRCCRSGWDIALTSAEADAYRNADVGRLCSQSQGENHEPCETVPGHKGLARIRKRLDGACVFLTPDGRCRIHEAWGQSKKPLTCRVFPFRIHPADGPPVVTASFTCPTIVANVGETLGSQAPHLAQLAKEWLRSFPEPEVTIEWVQHHPLPRGTLGTLRSVLREMLDRSGSNGLPDLRVNLSRMARTLEDLSRSRVLHLAPDAFAEYLALTGRYAARSDKPFTPHFPSQLGRLLSRGVLFAVAATNLRLAENRSGAFRLRLFCKVGRLFFSLHGLGPRVGRYDLRALRHVQVDLAEASVHAIVRNYVRATLETLGTGRRPVREEITSAIALLNAACAVAAMRAASAGHHTAGSEDVAEALIEAAQVAHFQGTMARVLAALSGTDAMHVFATGG